MYLVTFKLSNKGEVYEEAEAYLLKRLPQDGHLALERVLSLILRVGKMFRL